MKKLALALLLLAGITSCKKEEEKPTTTTPAEYKCPTCVTSPEAKSQYDNNSGGVYKGVLVGSSGTIALYLHNSGTDVKALIAFDGKSATLTTTSLSAWTPGQAINAAVFTGTLDGKAVTATLTVGTNGQNPVVAVVIPGHTNVRVAVYKETSTALIKNYEGTYAGTSTGTFNMTFNGNSYTIVTSDGGIYTDELDGGKVVYSNSTLEIKGEFKGDDVSGTWQDKDEPKNGTWAGKRTM